MHWQKIAVLFLIAKILSAATLHLKTGNIETTSDIQDFRRGPINNWRTGKSHYLLQFSGPVGQDQLDLLAARGAVITASIPDNAVMVAAGDDFSTDGLDLEFAGRLRPEHKVDSQPADAYVVEFHPDVDPADARQMLSEAGLTILDHPDLLPNHFLVAGSVQGFEAWDEVAYIFPASPELLSGERVQACPGMLTTQGMVPMYVTAGHGWAAAADGVTLKYVFGALTLKVPDAVTKQAIVNALTEWTKVANVHFVEGSDPTAARTVAIKFAARDHDDGFPFDGPGGILAHTFYPSPTNPEPIAGDIHLDGDEYWHSGSNTDIYTVALHETGHALGLAHSTQPGSVMYPYYRFGAKIGNDDIAGIQSLYGPPSAGGASPVQNPQLISLTIQSPSTTAVQTTAVSLALSGAVANAVGAVQVTWQTDHGASGHATGAAAWSIASAPLVTGSNTITVTVIDGNHKTASKSAVVTRNAPTAPDTIPPSINITSPGMTIMQTNLATLTVAGTAADNVGVTKVTWQNTLAGSGTATGTANWTASNIPLYMGTNTLVLRAFDAAGNNTWRSLTVIRH